MSKENEWEHYICSFCGRTRNEVECLLTGAKDTYICNECVTAFEEKLVKHKEKRVNIGDSEKELPTPMAICNHLDDYVIGQDEVKKILSVAMYNHYKRQQYKDSSGGVELAKSNVLIIGPTGSGKTLLAQTLARALDVPLAIVDATTLTEAGYVGEDVENIIQRLMQQSDYDMDRVTRGIIYIDEIDKIARKSDNPSITRDVSGEGVQQALLKLIEGTIASVPPSGGRKHPHQEYVQVDTTEILFICGGAFDGLANIVQRRCNKTVIGFSGDADAKSEDNTASFNQVSPEDLVNYGLIPELVGRLPVVGELHDLDTDALIDIFSRPKNSLAKQYTEMLSMDGVKLEFTLDGIRAIVEKAKNRGSGARGLRAVTEETLMETMFVVPNMKTTNKVVIDKTAVLQKRPLLMTKSGAKKRMPVKRRAA